MHTAILYSIAIHYKVLFKALDFMIHLRVTTHKLENGLLVGWKYVMYVFNSKQITLVWTVNKQFIGELQCIKIFVRQ